jgi:small multidrug resistance pump
MLNYVYLLIAVTFEVIGTSLLKATDGFTRPVPTVITLGAYATSFYVMALTLRTIPVGIAYAIWAGLGVVLIIAIAWVVYRQELDGPAILGSALILAGVLIVNLFSKTVTH